VLPGSPADVDPKRYRRENSGKSKRPDENREKVDFAILEHAFAEKKPVLAICYGCQTLNVFCNGTLTQDIHSERPKSVPHGHTDLPPGQTGDADHPATFTPGTRLRNLAGAEQRTINSSHHQAIEKEGEKLRVAARAPDGIIEAVEWTGDGNWVVGVQWHPERMPGDALAEALFASLVQATRAAAAHR
jgi:putative glutamine amidotransferase